MPTVPEYVVGTRTIIQLLNIGPYLLKAVMNAIEWCEADIALHLCPGRDLIDGTLTTAHLSRLEGGRSSKLVTLFTGMLHEML